MVSPITQVIAAIMFIVAQLRAAQQRLNAQKEQCQAPAVFVLVMLILQVIVVKLLYKAGLSGLEIRHAPKPAQP